jgi:uncharacterized RDD family membrane protein YckC
MQDDIATPPPLAAAGFWMRVLALIVDGLVLGGIGWVLGATMFDTLAQLGGWGRVIGFVIALAYFGILNSRVGGGQTLGKRFIGIRVQSLDGSLLSLPRSFARYVVLGVPFFLNNASFPPQLLTGPAGYVLTLLVFGGILSIVYLFVFNRATRRSLHDFAVGSWVVPHRAARAATPHVPLWRGHVIAVAGVACVCLALPVVAKQVMQLPLFGELLPAHEAVSTEPGVMHAQVNAGFQRGGGAETTYVAVQAQLSSPKVDNPALARALAQRVIAASPKFAERDVMQVTLVYGFDLGIASGWRAQAFRFDPAELR